MTPTLRSSLEAALAEIVRRHGPRLRVLALRFRGTDQAADDIVQETFWTAWREIGRWLPGGPPFAAWLTRIAVNRAIDSERRGKVRRFFGLDTAETVADGAPFADVALAARTELAAVARDIRDLPPRQRAAILIVASGERTNAEVAATLGVSEGAAEQLLVRARRTLRARLAARDAMKETEP